MNTCKLIASLIAVSYLSACGGGGSNGDLIPVQQFQAEDFRLGVFQPEEIFVNRCETPRDGVDPFTGAAFPDVQGSSEDEKLWLRSWSNDFYLWFDEIIDRDPAPFGVEEYFQLLRTEELTNSGNPRDRFHFSQDTAQSDNFFIGGMSLSHGIQFAFVDLSLPRNIRVSFVEPNSAAGASPVQRGDRLLSVNGIDVLNSSETNDVATINRGLSPNTDFPTHTYRFRRVNGDEYSVTLTAGEFQNSPVLQSQTLVTSTGNVGYLVFNDHVTVGEPQLVSAINQFNQDGISDLVLDMRYNGGGFLSVANRLSFMLAGPQNTQGRTFELLRLNEKHPDVDPFTGRRIEPMPFETNDSNGNPLPSLSLDRVFVLTTSATCSASESVINSLRGIDIEVIQIGTTTCGKPFGFYPTDNCGRTYFSINFQGVNDKGFGEFADGFIPSAQDNGEDFIRGCSVEDDLDHLLGDTEEALLSTALFHRENNRCPTGSALGNTKVLSVGVEAQLIKPEYRQVKLNK